LKTSYDKPDNIDLFQYQFEMLSALCPPLLGFGIGGSQGASKADQHSDLDFFLLVPNDQLFSFAKGLPHLITHPWPPVAIRDRGFWPDFGYQLTCVYYNECMIDYFINCEASLRLTPMARKTKILKDTTGQLSAYQNRIRRYCNSKQANADYISAASTETLIELLIIQKHVRRHDLIPVVHRLERLRLIYLGLTRHHTNTAPYVPHDADKRVHQYIEPRLLDSIIQTFPRCKPAEVTLSYQTLIGLLKEELLADEQSALLNDKYWELYYRISQSIEYEFSKVQEPMPAR
jgi:hypothetical protein